MDSSDFVLDHVKDVRNKPASPADMAKKVKVDYIRSFIVYS